jgi:hypothetical protein
LIAVLPCRTADCRGSHFYYVSTTSPLVLLPTSQVLLPLLCGSARRSCYCSLIVSTRPPIGRFPGRPPFGHLLSRIVEASGDKCPAPDCGAGPSYGEMVRTGTRLIREPGQFDTTLGTGLVKGLAAALVAGLEVCLVTWGGVRLLTWGVVRFGLRFAVRPSRCVMSWMRIRIWMRMRIRDTEVEVGLRRGWRRGGGAGGLRGRVAKGCRTAFCRYVPYTSYMPYALPVRTTFAASVLACGSRGSRSGSGGRSAGPEARPKTRRPTRIQAPGQG